MKKILLLLAANVAVDFCAQRNFGNLWCGPSHDMILSLVGYECAMQGDNPEATPATTLEFGENEPKRNLWLLHMGGFSCFSRDCEKHCLNYGTGWVPLCKKGHPIRSGLSVCSLLCGGRWWRWGSAILTRRRGWRRAGRAFILVLSNLLELFFCQHVMNLHFFLQFTLHALSFTLRM